MGKAAPRERPEYIHLTGTLYLERRSPTAGALYALATLLLLIPRETLFWTVREPSAWLLLHYPDIFLWLFEYYWLFGVGSLVAGLVTHLSVDPDPKPE